MKGLVLLGPPAAGKDTITTLLEQRSDLRLLRKVKAGSGRAAGYRLVSSETFDGHAERGEMISAVERYGNRYGILRSDVAAVQQDGHVPVVHTASPDEAKRLVEEGMALCLIWCSRSTSSERLNARDQSSVAERLAVWDQLQFELGDAESHLDIVVDTTNQSADEAARAIIAAVTSPQDPGEVRRQFRSIRPDTACVVPIVSLRHRSGLIDIDLVQGLVHRLVGAGCRVLVTGSTGEGDTLSPSERTRVRLAAAEVAGASAVNCYWGADDLDGASEDGDRLVVPASAAEADALRSKVGSSTMIYSHPRFGYVPSLDRLQGWRGAKLSKVAPSELPDVRSQVGSGFALWYGSAADPSGSFRLGADAVVAAELNAFQGSRLPSDPIEFRQTVNEIRSRWPNVDRVKRIKWLTDQARRAGANT